MRALGCDLPIIPGIMPVTSLASIKRMAYLSGSVIPPAVEERFAKAAGDGPEENREAVRAVGIDFATETAERLIAEGALWNSGYFLFRADVMLAELEAHAPEILAATRAALDAAVTDLDFVRLDAEAFGRAPKTSIDYAVMERTRHAGVRPVSFAWSDVGTWDAV